MTTPKRETTILLAISLNPTKKKKPKKVTIEICFITSSYGFTNEWSNWEYISIETISIKIKAEKVAKGKRFKGASI